MATPTKGDVSQTVYHFFINNGQRYIGQPGVFHHKIQSDDPSFNQVKAAVERSDIPCAELGETDINLYGIYWVGDPMRETYPDASSNGLPTPLWLFITESNRRLVEAEKDRAAVHAKLDQILGLLQA